MGKSFNRKFAVTIHYLKTGEKERIVLRIQEHASGKELYLLYV